MHLFIIHVMHLSTQIKLKVTSSSEKNVENELLPEQKSFIFPVNFLKTIKVCFIASLVTAIAYP